MGTLKQTAWLAFAVLISATLPAKADTATLRSSDNSIWGSVGSSLFNYKEPATAPNLPDSEHGWIPSIGMGVSMLTPDTAHGLASNLYLALEGSGSFGDAHYNGAYFYHPTVPLQGTTKESVLAVDGKLGKALPLGSMIMVIPYAELGYRYWDRNLGGGQTEDYQNFDFLGGLMLQVSPMDRLILSAYGSGGTTFSPQMQTGGVTYNLGDRGMYKIGGKVGFDVTPQIELFTTLDYDHLSFGQSGVINGAYEPNSNTEDTTWRVGLGYHFR